MVKISNFDQAHQVLNDYLPKDVASSYTLTRMRELMDALGNPQDKIKIIHVAGTSGKSSTAYYVASLLKQAGQKVGLSVSPHVDEVNERVQIDLQPLTEKVFCKELSQFIDVVKATTVKPTYFELLVAFAFWYFERQNVDYAVIEVGLGGLLDGTNIITNKDKISVITDIGLDHVHILGKNIPEITEQKAGIIQPHNAVFMYRQGSEVMNVVKERCLQQHAQLCELDKDEAADLDDIPPFQKRNFGLAKAVFDSLQERDNLPKLTAGKLKTAAHINIPARMEIVEFNGKTVIVDGSHNAQKMAALAAGLKKLFPDQPIAAMVSFVAHKEPYAPEALSELLPLLQSLAITTFEGSQDDRHKSLPAKTISQICDEHGFKNYKVIAEPKKAFEHLTKQSEPVLVVTGSFYLLNHIRPLILKA
jgi:dihydrofolate synthase / folylpolyglutamate synthase